MKFKFFTPGTKEELTKQYRDLCFKNHPDHGLTSPITVRKQAICIECHTLTANIPDAHCANCSGSVWDWIYVIIAGERRYRASKLIGTTHILAIIVEVSDEEASALMLSENTSRADLDPIDEANAYRIRIDKLGWSIEETAKAAGVSAIKVHNRIKLLSLHPDILHLIRSGNFSIGYAQILSEAKLDTNRQMLAFKCYRENPRPVLGWFRNIVNQYAQQQAQCSMFDAPLLSMQEIPIDKKEIDPPHPATTTPPTVGKTKVQILRNQVAFWEQAADRWNAIGKPFKKQECQAAAQAISYAVNLYHS